MILNLPATEIGEPVYFFGRQRKAWPKSRANLGLGGAWNFFARIGCNPLMISESGLSNISPSRDDLIVVVGYQSEVSTRVVEWLRKAREIKANIILSGDPTLFSSFTGIPIVGEITGHPSHALGWIGPHIEANLLAPPGWRVSQFGTCDGIFPCASIGGERHTPKRALVSKLEAYALVRVGNVVYLNGDPFGAFQAWLQGHDPLSPWLAWRHRLFWLDEHVVSLLNLLRGSGLPIDELHRPGIHELDDLTVVLRHDLDFSRDTSYLDTELECEVPAVHAALLDRNAKFWVNYVHKHAPMHELAFHYNTIARYSFWERVAMRLGWIDEPSYRPARRQISGSGLLIQARRAKAKGIGIQTLHRHGPYILYPETIDALDRVYQNEQDVHGSSTYFRGTVLRWGADRADGVRGYYGEGPDAMFPLWFPFKLCHAGDGGRLLRGFEMTCLSEPEPELVAQLLDYRNPELPQRVMMFNYHPAHANNPTFYKGGGLKKFREALEIILMKDAKVTTLASVYQKMNASIGRKSK